jgi:hypothetical protein
MVERFARVVPARISPQTGLSAASCAGEVSTGVPECRRSSTLGDGSPCKGVIQAAENFARLCRAPLGSNQLQRYAEWDSLREVHVTPWDSEQEFVYCYCLKLE